MYGLSECKRALCMAPSRLRHKPEAVGRPIPGTQGRRAAVTPVAGQMRLMNSDAIGRTLDYPIMNGYIGLITITPSQAGGFEAVRLPEMSDGPHFWYAVQWFMFTGIAVAGIVVFIRGDLKDRRKAGV